MDRKREKSCWHLSNPTMSQDVSLRDTYMKLKESCSLVDQTSFSDIQAVVQDDVASITLCHDSDEELSKSIIDESFMINDGSASNTTRTTDNDNDGDMDYSNCSRPYVPFSVEEVSLVRTLSLWSNRNVRVIGIAYPTDDLNFNLWKLVSIGEDGGPFSIIVDLTLAYFPAADCPIQVFGELQMMKNNHSPIIRVKFFRDFSSVDIFYHNKSVEVLKKYIPHFIDKRNPQPRLLDDSD